MFAGLQAYLLPQFREVFPSRTHEQTVVVVPSLSFDMDVLAKITGNAHYEERLLCMLMLLRWPRTKVVYLTSVPIHPSIVDYYLHLLPGIPTSHARRRLTLLSCHDDASRPLTEKLLARPRLLQRIREEASNPRTAHISCFMSTPLERTLAVRLGLPLYGCDPELSHLGDKSHGREIMREAGVPIPEGAEHLRDETDMADALAALKGRNPDLERAVTKLNEGFSGEGNAVFRYDGAPTGSGLASWVRDQLPARLRYEARGESWETYIAKYRQMRGIVEAFIEGDVKHSPTARYRINPAGEVETISVQDQVLGGDSGQVYLACRFPSDPGYRLAIQTEGYRVSQLLAERGVLGQIGIDFLCCQRESGWENYGIEINIRKGGATHPFLMLRYLTDGRYDPETATFRTPSGETRAFLASDNVQKDEYRGLSPDDLVDIAVENEIHFNSTTQKGVVFHLIGALSRYGKLGMLSIDDTLEGAERQYNETLGILDREAGR